MKKKLPKWMYWAPRVVSILFICFLAFFSLDVITPEASLSEVLLGLFMHNIPVFILIVLVVISWKHEIVGGIGFIMGGIFYISLILKNIITKGFEWYYLALVAQISGMAFIIGTLFLINWRRKR